MKLNMSAERRTLVTPEGTLSEMRLFSRMRPSPPHFSQGTYTCPTPSQRGHEETCWKAPKGVRTACTNWPVPWHWGQVLGEVPLFTPLPSQVCIACIDVRMQVWGDESRSLVDAMLIETQSKIVHHLTAQAASLSTSSSLEHPKTASRKSS